MMRAVLAIAMKYPGLPAPWLLDQPEHIITTITTIEHDWKK